MEFIINNYTVLKTLHLLAVFAWGASLLFLPLLYRVHVAHHLNLDFHLTMARIEKTWLRFVANPAMVIALIMGLIMMKTQDMVEDPQGWLHAKLFFVVVLLAAHGFLAKTRKILNDRRFNDFPEKINNILIILIILSFTLALALAVAKPF